MIRIALVTTLAAISLSLTGCLETFRGTTITHPDYGTITIPRGDGKQVIAP